MRMKKFLYKKNKTRNGLSIHKRVSCDIPPVPITKPVLSVAQVQTTDVRPQSKPNLTVSRAISVDIPPDPTQNPSQKMSTKPITMQKFMDIVRQSETSSRPEKQDRQDVREKDLLNFKRSMGFPP